jgi:hypothetical protein
MARANISIDETLKSSFEKGGCSFLRLSIQDTSVILLEIEPIHPTGSSAWNALRSKAEAQLEEQTAQKASSASSNIMSPSGGSSINPITPSLFLYCIDPSEPSTTQWCIVSFTPEGKVSPRSKMVYAAARDDLKRTLGASRFLQSDYHTTELMSELNEEAFNNWKRRDVDESLTSNERIQSETRKQALAERSQLPVRMATMTKVPFKVSEALKDAFLAFKDDGTNSFVEVLIEQNIGGTSTTTSEPLSPGVTTGESLVLNGHGIVNSEMSVIDRVSASVTPVFFFARLSDSKRILFLYHCPESAKPKSRMLYSTGKSAVLTASGIDDILMFKAETRDKDDVSTAMTEYLAGSSTTISSSASTSSSSSSSSSFESSSSTPITRKVQGVGLPGMSPPLISGGAASVGVDSNFSKPTRAGRGSRTVAAFEYE